jgi:hypothetical protein
MKEHRTDIRIDSWFYNGGTIVIVTSTTLATVFPSILPTPYAWIAQILTAVATILVALQRTLSAAERYTFHREMLSGYRSVADAIDTFDLVPADKQQAYTEQIRRDLLALRRREAGLPGVTGATQTGQSAGT